MVADYSILLQSPGAVPLKDLDRIHRCSYARSLNDGGALTLTVPNGLYDPSIFQPFGRLLVQRSLPGVPPYVDLDTSWFIVGGPVEALADDGSEILRVECVDALGLILKTRNVAYNDYNDFTDKLEAADDMCKSVVSENAGPDATDTERDLSGFMNIASDVTAAPVIRMGSFARQQVLDVLQDIADASRNDPTTPTWLGFDVALADVNSGLIEFRTYVGQRGNDHTFPAGSPPVVLSVEDGSLANAEVGTLYGAAASYIYAGGAGVGDIRAIAPAQNDEFLALSPFARFEQFVDGGQIVDPDALQALAYAKLREYRPRRYLAGQIVEIPNVLRGVQWDYGDLLTATYRGLTYNVLVEKIRVTIEAARGGGLNDSSEAFLRGEEAIPA